MSEVVFDGDGGRFDEAGCTERKRLRGLGVALPAGMVAGYEVRWSADGAERVWGFVQARSRHGRRYFVERGDGAETRAQTRLLRWAKRVLREREVQS